MLLPSCGGAASLFRTCIFILCQKRFGWFLKYHYRSQISADTETCCERQRKNKQATKNEQPTYLTYICQYLVSAWGRNNSLWSLNGPPNQTRRGDKVIISKPKLKSICCGPERRLSGCCWGSSVCIWLGALAKHSDWQCRAPPNQSMKEQFLDIKRRFYVKGLDAAHFLKEPYSGHFQCLMN